MPDVSAPIVPAQPVPPAQPVATPVMPPAPVPPFPPATDPVSGAVIQQASQTAAATPQVIPQGKNKEGLPTPTEIPLATVQPQAPEGQTPAVLEQAPATSQAVETEPAKELEPEVQELQEKIAQHKLAGAQQTVVRANTLPTTPPNTVAQPVVVLPLSEKGMTESKSKNPTHSIRWLREWCVRQIRKVKDMLVVYRDP